MSNFPYASLQSAASDAYNALWPTYQNAANATLGVAATANVFAQAVAGVFPLTNASSLPCANSFAIVYALIAQLPSAAASVTPTNMPAPQFAQFVQAVAKLLSLASYLNAATPQLVTNAQAASLLAAFNTAFSVG